MTERIFELRQFARTATACLAIALLSSCGGDDGNGQAPPAGGTPTPTPTTTPTPTPPPSITYIDTPAPLGLTESTTFDVFGWEYHLNTLFPATAKFRWNASAKRYEIQYSRTTNGYEGWAFFRLRAGTNNHDFDAFPLDGIVNGVSMLPYEGTFLAPPPTGSSPKYVGDGIVFGEWVDTTFFAFGAATTKEAIPQSGIATCDFGWGTDDVGDGRVVIDYSGASATGWIRPYWGPPTQIELTSVAFMPNDEIIVRATFGGKASNLMEARLYGPSGQEIAVRAKGDVQGIMTGFCKG